MTELTPEAAKKVIDDHFAKATPEEVLRGMLDGALSVYNSQFLYAFLSPEAAAEQREDYRQEVLGNYGVDLREYEKDPANVLKAALAKLQPPEPHP